MATNASVIKQFMVGLGFKIDETGMKRFASSIAVQTETVNALAEGLKEVAIKVVDFSRNVAESMDQLWFTSQRVKASATNLQALGYAAKQSGLSVDSVSAAIENLHKFLTVKPSAETLLQNIGVATRDTNGDLRDTVDIFKDVKGALAALPAYRANSYAEMLGIDWKTLSASGDAIDKFADEYKAMAHSLGLSTDQAAESGHKFQTVLRRIRGWLDILADKVGVELANKLQKPLDQLSQWLIDHGPEIGKFVDNTIDNLRLLVPVIAHFAERGAHYLAELIKWFSHLSGPVKTAVSVMLALIPVALAVGAGILALSGIITALGTVATAAGIALDVMGAAVDVALGPIGLLSAAIVGLTLDFEHWKKTGKSFIPWGSWKDQIHKAGQDIKDIGNYLGITHSDSPSNGSYGNARGFRNRNPGNIEYGNFARTHGATGVEAKGRYATFATDQAGLDALAALLEKYSASGINTVRAIIEKYAPAKDGNPPAYAQTAAKRLGFGLDTQLNLSDAQILSNLMSSIVKFENGKQPYSSTMLALAASRAGAVPPASTGSQITIHQAPINVYGAADPRATGAAVGNAVRDANERLIRNLQARVS